MDLQEIMRLADKNSKNATKNKVSQYSTSVPPAKKLQKTVNPNAIKNLLKQKEKAIKTKELEDNKRKESLIELRKKSKKTMARANAMAKRTKDNFHGLNEDEIDNREDMLSPEAALRHKNFMKNLEKDTMRKKEKTKKIQSMPLVKDDNEKNRKMEKSKKKARSAANLNFTDLLQIAQNHANKNESSSSAASDDGSSDSDDDNMTIEEKYRLEKLKRRKLQEKLANAKGSSTKKTTKRKLETNLSEDMKQAKIKAIMKKFKKSPNEQSLDKSTCQQNNNKGSRKSEHNKIINGNKYKEINKSINHVNKKKSNGFNNAKNNSTIKDIKTSVPNKAKCTLKITSESVRTNYPGVAKKDPYLQNYGSVRGPKTLQRRPGQPISAEQIVCYQRNMGRHKPQEYHRSRPGVITDNDDEYDSDMDGFIEDEDEEVDISSHIKSIFGYDRAKYGRESEWELERMESSYSAIEKEEKKSLRIARAEDAKEAKLEEERLKRLLKKKR